MPTDLAALRALADAAQRALRRDGVLLVARDPEGACHAACRAGVDEPTASAIVDALVHVAPSRLAAGPRTLDALLPAGVAAVAPPGVWCVATGSDPLTSGVLCAVGGEGEIDDAAMRAFARHVGVALTEPAPAGAVTLGTDTIDALAISSRTIEELTRAVGRLMAGALGVEKCALLIHDENRGILQMTPGSFDAPDATTASYQVDVNDPSSTAARVVATGQPYLSNDVADDPGIRAGYVRAFGIRRLLSVPLLLDRRPVGVLHLANRAEPFTGRDLAHALAQASAIAPVVESIRVGDRLDRAQRMQRALSTVAMAIARGDETRGSLASALHDFCAAAGASLIALVAPHAQPLLSRGRPARPELERELIAEARAVPPASLVVRPPAGVGDPGSALLHEPIELSGRRVGTVSALRARAEPFAADEQHAFARLAQLAALAWASERYQEQRAQLARLEERQRIAGEFQDDVRLLLLEAQQELDGVLDAGSLGAEQAADVARARGFVIRAYSAVRAAVHESDRTAPGDLPQRLRTVVSAARAEWALQARLELDDAACERARGLSLPAADALVRVAREAVVNAAKHGAGRCVAVVRLERHRDTSVRLVVTDDGPGIERRGRSANHGLTFLRRVLGEHGGRLRVTSRPDGGTRVVATLPVDRDEQAA